MDTEVVTTEEAMPEVVREVEEVVPEVAEVLVKVPKSPRHLERSLPQVSSFKDNLIR